ncbi:MAG: amidohydrolase family protein [Actinomycetota bacterium]|nr:amidohydrolase family protein [Actinomycetota bacterium]MDQ2955544.1 amidohydrolase family protein [Actinomycetota bacterium]
MSETTLLIRGGYVLSLDDAVGDLPRGDVLITADRISAIGVDLDVVADEVIDATDRLVIPGLIDSHNHLWQSPLRGLADECWADEYFGAVHPTSGRFDADDMYTATYASAVDMLAVGVTTTFDFCHSVNSLRHADASIAALQAAGLRAIFGYSFRDRPEVARRSFHGLDDRIADVSRVHADMSKTNSLVQLGIALNNIEQVEPAVNARELAAARELGVPVTVHSNYADQVRQLHHAGLLGPDLQWVHACKISDDELAMLAGEGGTISATPDSEIGMSGLYPATGRAVRHGVPVALGIDIQSALSNDMFRVLRLTFELERMREGQLDWLGGRHPERRPGVPSLSARDVLRLGTIDGARALGLGAVTGSLTVGKQADVLVLSTGRFGLGYGDPAAHVVVRSGAEDVDTVIVAGQVRVRAGQLVDVDLAELRDSLAKVGARVTGR